MMKPVVIFGLGEFAELAYFYLNHDSDYKVAAFTVDNNYITEDQFYGLPVVAFEEVTAHFSPLHFDMFIAIGYSDLNAVRTKKYIEAKQKGYNLISYISSKTITWPGLITGENCFLMENNTIQPFVQIGNNVIICSGNLISHHVQIGDNCFISSHVIISGGVKIGDNCFIGINSTIREHIKVAKNCIIGAGSLILKDTQENGGYLESATKLCGVNVKKLRHML